MNASPAAHGPHRDEIVVTIPYARLVCAQLEQWEHQPVITDSNDRLGLSKITLRADGSLDAVLGRLRRHFADAYAGWVPTMGKNRLVERLRGSYVIDGGDTGQLQRLRGKAAPRSGRAGEGTRVGIVDTRLFPHRWLAGAYLAGSDDLLSDGAGPLAGGDDSAASHATFVAGLVLRQAPGAQLRVLAGLDEHARSDSWSVAVRVAELADEGLDVLNLSFGCTTQDNRPPLVLSAAVSALPPRTLVVAAAGNHGEPGEPAQPVYPAALDDVVAVGALDQQQLAAFSPDSRWVDALAPGVDVVSACHPDSAGKGSFGRWSGTSFASAVVTGAIAARVRPGVTSRDAWADLRAGSDEGPVQIVLAEVAGWPTV